MWKTISIYWMNWMINQLNFITEEEYHLREPPATLGNRRPTKYRELTVQKASRGKSCLFLWSNPAKGSNRGQVK